MDPATQYQRQKIIQKTVRVYASLYTMNLGALSSYQRPLNRFVKVEQAGTSYFAPPRVYWNQMSDRAIPSVQTAVTSPGSIYRAASTRRTIVRDRPGALSPGGIGVDIKHNSYDRYLKKLKGIGPLRRGTIPPDYGVPYPFIRAYPIYGGKVLKTGIVNTCNCPEEILGDKYIYENANNGIQDKILDVTYKFHIGDFVWVKKSQSDSVFYKAIIESIENELAIVQTVEDNTRIALPKSELLIFFECNNCQGLDNIAVFDQLLNINDGTVDPVPLCNILNIAADGELL
jgi:hypothetical protein